MSMKQLATLLFTLLLAACGTPTSSQGTLNNDPSQESETESSSETCQSSDPSTTDQDAAPEETETIVCGCDDTTNLDDSTVAECLTMHLATCTRSSGGLWTDFGSNFVYIPGESTAEGCPFILMIEEEGFRQKFECRFETDTPVTNTMLGDPYWATEDGATRCTFLDSCTLNQNDCEHLGPSCLDPF